MRERNQLHNKSERRGIITVFPGHFPLSRAGLSADTDSDSDGPHTHTHTHTNTTQAQARTNTERQRRDTRWESFALTKN